MKVQTKELGSQYFQGGLGTPAMELMCNMTKPLWVTGKTYIMDSRLCVFKGLVGMLDIGIYGKLFVKKFKKGKTGIHRYEINAPFKKREIMTASQDIGRVLTLICML